MRYAKKKTVGTFSEQLEQANDISRNNPEKVLGFVEVARVVRDHMPLIATDTYGPTIGNQIDDMLAGAVKGGEELQSFKIEFDERRWSEFAKSILKPSSDEADSFPN
jgi:hypothetical protein